MARLVRRRPALATVQRLPRATVITVLVVISVASLAWSIHQTVDSPTSAYFSTFTRAWELGAGTLMALVPPSAVRQLRRASLELVAAVGAFAVLASCLIIREDTPFPGIAAMLPVLGTAMLLLVGTAPVPTVVGRFLALAPMRRIGDWSYSLYLWHWPLLVIPVEALHRDLTPLERVAAMGVAVALSGLSYTFVETPFRTGRAAHRLPRRQALLLYPVSALLVVATTAGGWAWTGYQGGEHGHTPAIAADTGDLQASGEDHTLALVRASVTAARQKMAIPSNLTPDLLNLRNSVANVGDCDYTQNVQKLCQAGDPNGTRTLVVIGDSHARAWIPAFDRINAIGKWRAFYLVKPQCTAAHVEIASTESDEPFTDCSQFQNWVVDQVRTLHPDLVVVASSPPVNGVFVNGRRTTTVEGITPALRAGYDDLFFQLQEYAGQVALIRDVPKSPDDPATCLGTGSPNLSSCMFTPVERSTELGNVAVASARAAGIDVVDPTPWLCWQGECPVVIGGTLSYRDTDHITTEYAANLWAELGRALDMLPAT